MNENNQLTFEVDGITKTEHELRIKNIASSMFKTSVVLPAELKATQRRLDQIAQMKIKNGEATKENATEVALTFLEETLASKGKKTPGQMRALHSRWIKELCLKNYKPDATVTAREIREYANGNGYECESAKGIGDTLGRGGLFLEPTPIKKGQKAYRIPDPTEHAYWYENEDVPLKRSYYSNKHWDYLYETEASNPATKFVGFSSEESHS